MVLFFCCCCSVYIVVHDRGWVITHKFRMSIWKQIQIQLMSNRIFVQNKVPQIEWALGFHMSFVLPRIPKKYPQMISGSIQFFFFTWNCEKKKSSVSAMIRNVLSMSNQLKWYNRYEYLNRMRKIFHSRIDIYMFWAMICGDVQLIHLLVWLLLFFDLS